MITINSKGLTLAELLLATGILVFVLSGVLILFVNCSFLNQANRNFSTAMTHAQFVMEQLRNEETIEEIKAVIDASAYVGFTDLAGENISVCNGDDGAPPAWVCTCSLGGAPNVCEGNPPPAGVNPIQLCVRVDWNDRRGRANNIELYSALTNFPGSTHPDIHALDDCVISTAAGITSVDCDTELTSDPAPEAEETPP